MRVLMPEPGAAFTALARALAERFNALPATTRTGEIHLQTRRLDGELVLQGAGEDWHLPYTHWHEDLGRLPHRRLQMWCTALVEALIPRLDAERWVREPLRFRWLHYSVGDSASLVLARHGITIKGPVKSTSVRSRRMGGGILCMGADALAFIADNPGTPPQHYPHADIVSAHLQDIGVYGLDVTLALRTGRARFEADDWDDNTQHNAYFTEHLPDIAELLKDRKWEEIIGHADFILARDHLHEHMALSGAYVETGRYPESGKAAEAYLARHPDKTLQVLTRMHWVCAVWQVTGQAEKVIDAFQAIEPHLPTPLPQTQAQMLSNMMGPIVSAPHEVRTRMLAHYSPDSQLRMHHHNFACLFAAVGERSNAVTALERAIEQGETWAMIEEEEDFAALLEDEDEVRRLQGLIDDIGGLGEPPIHEHINTDGYGPADVAQMIETHREAPETYEDFIADLGRIGTNAAIDYLKELIADADGAGNSRAQAFLALAARGDGQLLADANAAWEKAPATEASLWMELRNITPWVEDIGRFKRDLAASFDDEGEFAADTLEPRKRDLDELLDAIETGDVSAVEAYVQIWADQSLRRKRYERYGRNFALDQAAEVAARRGDDRHAAVLAKLIAAADEKTLATTLVKTASEPRDIGALRALLNAGANADVRTQGGEQALTRALYNNNVKAAYWLLKHGADPKPHYHPEHPYGKGGEDLIDRLLESALAGDLQTPRALLPDNAELETNLRRRLAGLATLGRAHADEHFYVLGTDEDELRANSEEAFAATLAERIARHDERKPTDLHAGNLAAALGWEDEGTADLKALSARYRLAAGIEEDDAADDDFEDLDELAEAVNALHADYNEDLERRGNPYRDDPDTVYRLRYDIDAWTYDVDDTQIDQTQTLDLTPLQTTREDDTRSYAELMRDLLLANQKTIAAYLPLTRDFTVIASGQPVTPRTKIPT